MNVKHMPVNGELFLLELSFVIFPVSIGKSCSQSCVIWHWMQSI